MLTSFEPDARVASAVFAAIASGRSSLVQIAESHATTLDALCLWLARPDIREQTAAIDSAAVAAARAAAMIHTPLALGTLAAVLRTHQADDDALARHPSPERAIILRQRHRESTRRAATHILSMTRLQPLARAPRPAAPASARQVPTPAGHTVEADHRETAAAAIAPPTSPPAAVEPRRLASRPVDAVSTRAARLIAQIDANLARIKHAAFPLPPVPHAAMHTLPPSAGAPANPRAP